MRVSYSLLEKKDFHARFAFSGFHICEIGDSKYFQRMCRSNTTQMIQKLEQSIIQFMKDIDDENGTKHVYSKRSILDDNSCSVFHSSLTLGKQIQYVLY